MFKDDYKASFSKVTASEVTYRRVMNMANKKKTRSGSGIVGKLLIAAAVLSMLVLTVSAAENGWFQKYFEDKNEKPLSQSQVEFIEQNEQPINESQSQAGYTLKLKSVITDGYMTYITVGITGPEDAVLSKTVIDGYSPEAPSIIPANWGAQDYFTPADGGESTGWSSIESREDYDGLDNTQDLVMTARPDAKDGEPPFAPGRVWKLHMEDLVATYLNAAYQKELDEKYQGRENFMYADEEGEKLYPKVVLAEGAWDFEIDFRDCDTRSFQLIREPVTAKANTDGMNGTYEDVRITSFTLSSLSAVVTIENDSIFPEFDYDFTGRGESKQYVYAVLKDGTQISLRARSFDPGVEKLEAERPIPLDQVDYVLLLDGTKLPVP